MPKAKKHKKQTPSKKSPAIVQSLDSRDGLSVGFDYFRNLAARMGYGTPSLAEGTEYEMVRLSNDYWLMLTLYRNHWISRRIVDLPSDDMTKSWCHLTSQLPPDDIQKFDRVVERTFTPLKINQAIKWSRLYGGAGALILVKGHESKLAEPLDLDEVNPGSYLGLIPFDRWSGIWPKGNVAQDIERPLEWGLPEMYEVTPPGGSVTYDVHTSRILRFTGPEVPKPENQAQLYWGISVLEIVYEELRKRDNASWSILQLLFRAQILAQRNKELAQLLSGVGMSQKALQMFEARMNAQNQLLSNQSMLILGEDGELQSHQFTFSGLAEVYAQFQMDVAGAAEIPVTRLFGRTITGLGQSNDADERIYEEKIAHEQQDKLKLQLTKLYPVICMSVLGEVPDDLDFKFPSVRVLTEEDKSEMTTKASAPIIASYNAGITGRKTTLKELRELSDKTGVFTNITDEQIDKAEEEPELPGEGMEGEFSRVNPQREERKLAQGAMDSEPSKTDTVETRD